ncbi:DUF4214 domain-containing protein [Pseudomonas sp. NPDC087358]|uniref:DUF4214 domain-containing protein n=1 Tax=Pseudomonas sp. NPDC087358 TaxID=3364439 RepID=UPI003850B28E
MSRVQTEASVQELYIGILGRAADYAGLKYWTDAIENGTQSLENTRASFATPNQAEYWTIYGGLSSSSLVDKVYQNFLERTADVAGKAYWVSELDSGKIGADFFVNAVTNAAKDPSATDPQTLLDAKVLANKVQAAQYFTSKAQTASASDSSFITQAKAAVDNVNSDAASVTAANSASDSYAAKLPAPALVSYDDHVNDAGGFFKTATPISLTTEVSGVLGLRYSATEKDTYDYYTFTAAKDGNLVLDYSGNDYISFTVSTKTSALMNNVVEQAVNQKPVLDYHATAQVFAGEQVTIQLAGASLSGTETQEYNFHFSMA